MQSSVKKSDVGNHLPFATNINVFVITGQVSKMSIAQAAAKAMLSDALLQDSSGIYRLNHLELELPLDKVIKYVSVGLPLMLVCMAFTREISLGK